MDIIGHSADLKDYVSAWRQNTMALLIFGGWWDLQKLVCEYLMNVLSKCYNDNMKIIDYNKEDVVFSFFIDVKHFALVNFEVRGMECIQRLSKIVYAKTPTKNFHTILMDF